jgi:small conductance mechanosensitive channel
MRLQAKNGVDKGVLTFTASFANIFIRTLTVIIALAQIGVDMSVAVGAFSAMGLGISLALKENMANVASGLQILITKPFRVGDYIAFNDKEGTVTEIDLMFTALTTFDNQQVIIPNASLISDSIVNYSAFPSRRIVIQVCVDALSDFSAFRQKAVDIMESYPGVLKDPKPKTVTAGLNDAGNGMQINCVCHTSIEEYWDVLYGLIDQLHDLRRSQQLDPPVVRVESVASPAERISA